MSNKLKIGITQGDINGVGFEVILKALVDSHILEVCSPVIYGSTKAATYHKKMLDINSYTVSIARSIDEINPNKVSLVNVSNEEVKVELGQESVEVGRLAYTALEMATADLMAGKIDAIVTAPINKKTIQNESFNFPGHTEYFESKTEDKSLMLLVSDNLRVALVSTHMPLGEVAKNVTQESVLDKIKLLNKSLVEDFAIIKPRIAVLSLNPQSGDGGLLGNEEKEYIAPAIAQANAEGMVCVGPLAADGFFGSGNFKKYDAVLAMYHDQGLAPFKSLSMDRGVNVTAGLPIVRTSPAHGTAYDIAGKNVADELSMREAIYLACSIARNRRNYAEMRKNPLPFVKNEDRRGGRNKE